ncbi:MAG: hypothetical protein J6B89_03420 [Bacilli bacterium]|nr:hypothetical protein [Bacilli bacterium]
MNNPEYVKIGDEKYTINTDFRVAIECNNIAESNDIGDTERALAIIYKLFGDKGLNSTKDWEKLLELGIKYLCLGKELDTKEDPDMDFEQDKYYIRSSFIQDYKYNPYDLDYLHWWDFFNDLSNLSNSEFGNCCVLNRIRALRTYDVSKIKDSKEKAKIIEAKQRVALKKIEKTQHEEDKIQNKFFDLLEEGDSNE